MIANMIQYVIQLFARSVYHVHLNPNEFRSADIYRTETIIFSMDIKRFMSMFLENHTQRYDQNYIPDLNIAYIKCDHHLIDILFDMFVLINAMNTELNSC